MLQLAQVALPTFDLSFVKERILKREADKWTPEKLAAAELDYRQFMATIKATPGTPHSPTGLADEIWHEHILFTREYTRDMQNYIGHFVHHVPMNAAQMANWDSKCSSKCKDCCSSGGSGDACDSSVIPEIRGH